MSGRSRLTTARFAGQVALVTGAGSGIGLATARAFAHEGAAVALTGVHEDSVRQAADELVAAGHRALGIGCDVTDDAQVAAMVDQTVATFGRLDAAFNNAGVIYQPTSLVDESRDLFDRTVAVNLRGVWTCMQHEVRQMLRQGGGSIVNCSSMGGLAGASMLATYSATKHAVVGLTRSAALEYATRGIRINAVCPGMIETPMADVLSGGADGFREVLAREEPIGRLGRPEEIADAVLWLCGPGASFVIGHALAVDGGITAR